MKISEDNNLNEQISIPIYSKIRRKIWDEISSKTSNQFCEQTWGPFWRLFGVQIYIQIEDIIQDQVNENFKNQRY